MTLQIAIAGLGTVGVGTFKILQEKAALLERRSGRTVKVTAVSSRDKSRDRGIDTSNVAWEEDARKLCTRDDVDLVVEVIGGADGIAYDVCKSALENGKHVVTANKALIAKHGVELATIAEKNNVHLAFEAAVAGGIPILKALREGLAANEFRHIVGILNGTCNYILTTMEETGRDFGDILKEAQDQGYAEADPSFDIDGIDAAHKLAIIASLAYGVKINFDDVFIEGIRDIALLDITSAKELGYKIKLLGMCRKTADGIEARVHPCMVPEKYPIAKVDGVFNAVIAQCDHAGKSIYEGRGAGEGPTASSVIADIMDIAADRASYPFNMPVASLESLPIIKMDALKSAYYIRLNVVDEPGVLAEITKIFQEHSISMKSLLQQARNPAKHVQVVVTTHATKEKEMMSACKKIANLRSVQEAPHIIRIEELV